VRLFVSYREAHRELRRLLKQGKAGWLRWKPWHHVPATKFHGHLDVVREQHPDLSDHEMTARAAYRVLTENKPPRNRWVLAVVIALALLLAILFLARRAKAEPTPDYRPIRERMFILHRLLAQGTGGIYQYSRLQVRSVANAWTDVGYAAGNLSVPVQITASLPSGSNVIGAVTTIPPANATTRITNTPLQPIPVNVQTPIYVIYTQNGVPTPVQLTEGQATMMQSIPVVLASDQSAYPVTISGQPTISTVPSVSAGLPLPPCNSVRRTNCKSP